MVTFDKGWHACLLKFSVNRVIDAETEKQFGEG